MKRSVLASVTLSLCLISAALAQAKLEFKHREGKTTTVSTTKSRQVLTIAGMEIETTSEAVTTSSSTTGKPGPDGTVRIQEKVESMKVSLGLPGGLKVTYDSSVPDAKSDIPQIQAILDGFRAVDGKSYTFVLGKDGRVAAVEGLQQILETAPQNAVEELKRRLNPETLKREANEVYGKLPDQPVNRGDRWSRTEVSQIGGGQTFTFENYYEYQGTVEKDGKTLDKIGIYTASVKYAIDPNVPSPLQVVNSDLKVESSSGTLLFDREEGRIIESSSIVRIAGPMTFSVNGMELAGKVDLTMDSGSTVKK